MLHGGQVVVVVDACVCSVVVVEAQLQMPLLYWYAQVQRPAAGLGRELTVSSCCCSVQRIEWAKAPVQGRVCVTASITCTIQDRREQVSHHANGRIISSQVRIQYLAAFCVENLVVSTHLLL